MSTDARLDFSFSRAADPIVRRVLSDDALPIVAGKIEIARIAGAEDDRYVSRNIGHMSRATFLVI